MFSDTDGVRKADYAKTKEIKVQIPVRYHIKLHSLKVLHGTQISSAVTEALERYFSDVANAQPGSPTPEAALYEAARGDLSV